MDCMLDRVNSMYQRDKNHPAILIWSCGNESFGGKVIFEMSQLYRKMDPTRLCLLYTSRNETGHWMCDMIPAWQFRFIEDEIEQYVSINALDGREIAG